MFKDLLKKNIDGETLTRKEAKYAMDTIMDGKATESQIASLITVLRFRGETIEEMTGFAESMRNHVITFEHDMNVIDTCGTGGDGASTYNISTATALVLSALDVKVAKHGNRAMSSKSGSADVLERLGIPIQSSIDEARQALKTYNMCFLFAPLYHVSMKHAAPSRKDIGFRTIFNLLGPLTNPANCQQQLIGVFNTTIAEKMAHVLRNLGVERALFVTGGDGIDECSITTHTDIIKLEDGEITREVLNPEDVGLRKGNLKDITVGSVQESAELIMKILSGHGNDSASDILYLNAGAGLYAAGSVETIAEGVHEAMNAVKSGKVISHLYRMRDHTGVRSHA